MRHRVIVYVAVERRCEGEYIHIHTHTERNREKLRDIAKLKMIYFSVIGDFLLQLQGTKQYSFESYI